MTGWLPADEVIEVMLNSFFQMSPTMLTEMAPGTRDSYLHMMGRALVDGLKEMQTEDLIRAIRAQVYEEEADLWAKKVEDLKDVEDRFKAGVITGDANYRYYVSRSCTNAAALESRLRRLAEQEIRGTK